MTIIEDSIDSISEFSSTKQKARQIGEIVKVTLRALNPKIKKNKIRINLSLDPNCPAILTPPGLFRVFQNVIRNATNELLKKGPENREIKISSHFDEVNKIIVVYIADNGMGIALNSETTAQDIASLVKINEVIFKPHFDPSGKGLGLPFSRKILKAMGGDIRVSETSSHGTTFEIIMKADGK